MNTEKLESEKEYIAAYQEKGFTHSYRMENDALVDVETKEKFEPTAVHVLAEHRFEGKTNPSDMSILYVIETADGTKGTVLANYSPASDTAMAEFFNAIPKENQSQKANIHDVENWLVLSNPCLKKDPEIAQMTSWEGDRGVVETK